MLSLYTVKSFQMLNLKWLISKNQKSYSDIPAVFLSYSCSILLTSLPPLSLFFSFSLHLVMFSNHPSLEKRQHLHWLNTLFVLVISQTFSPLFCVFLSVVFLSASLKLQNRKTPLSKSNCCLLGWPTPTVRVLHMRSDGRKIFASSIF